MPERRYTTQDVTVERSADNPKIAGYAAVYYDGTDQTEYELPWNGARERIMPGAFDRALSEGDDARALFNHDPNMVLGRRSAGTLRIESDSRGLRYEVDPPASRADVVEALERGDVRGSSFSFRVRGEQWEKEDGRNVRKITDVELYDVGPVTFPAYDSTTAGVRSEGEAEEAKRSLAEWEQQQASAEIERVKARARAVEIEVTK